MRRSWAASGRPRVRTRPGNVWRHRVVPTGMQWMAAQQPADGQPTTAHQAEPSDRLHRVGAARRRVPAGRQPQRAHGAAVQLDRCDGDASRAGDPRQLAHGDPTRRNRAASRSLPIRADSRLAASGKARTTVPLLGGRRSSRCAICARSRRATRCRITLPPTDLPTTKPTIGALVPVIASALWCTTTQPRRAREPERTTAVKSSDRRILFTAGSTARDRRDQADSSRRPLRRRAEMIARPARVRMRSRKPCVLARRRLFG